MRALGEVVDHRRVTFDIPFLCIAGFGVRAKRSKRRA